jgi:hypothetical protein
VTKFRQEILSAVRLVWKRDWKLIDNEEVEEVVEPPLKKLASRSLLMKKYCESSRDTIGEEAY